jgi:hypothetical protein
LASSAFASRACIQILPGCFDRGSVSRNGF